MLLTFAVLALPNVYPLISTFLQAMAKSVCQLKQPKKASQPGVLHDMTQGQFSIHELR